jgi:hypothetical protein
LVPRGPVNSESCARVKSYPDAGLGTMMRQLARWLLLFLSPFYRLTVRIYEELFLPFHRASLSAVPMDRQRR